MQRTMAVYTLATSVILALGVPAAHTLTAHTRPVHPTSPTDRVTACASCRAREPRMMRGLAQGARPQ